MLRIDDALDVSSIHGLTGVLGALLVGVYASKVVNPDGPEASAAQCWIQAGGVLVAILWSGCGSALVMRGLECVLGRAGVRADDEEEQFGLDRSQHGESSYLDLQALV